MGSSRLRAELAAARALFPRGGALPTTAWNARHEGICVVLWVHVAALLVIGFLRDQSVTHTFFEASVVAWPAVIASMRSLRRLTRSSAATLGLMASSAILVHYFGGLIEMHFHFFVMVALVSLYQAWTPYLLGIGFVLLHHVVVGVLAPTIVYNHTAAIEHPTAFAALHSAFILAESIALMSFWRVTEEAVDRERVQRVQVEEANTALSRVNREVSDLVGMMSHDLRTPVAVIKGFTELALGSWATMTEEQRLDAMERINRAGTSLQAMLEDTLTVSALNAGGLVPRTSEVCLDEAVKQALAALPTPLPGMDLSHLHPVVALADTGHLGQVLTNLVTNAAKYGAPPYLLSTGEHGDEVTITVADSGSGVPEEFVPKLFDRYTRADEARAGAHGGIGLGLYIAHRLVAANGGELCYDRSATGGAAFTVRLRRAIDAGQPATTEAIAARSAGSSGVTMGANLATGVPSAETRNFSKFH